MEDVRNLVKECFAETDVDIPNTGLDKAHRTGRAYKDEPDQSVQRFIVKFNNFRYRSMFYKNRKKLKRGKRIRIDLASNRYNFLDQEKHNQTYENGEHYLYICRCKLQTKSC